MAQYQTEPQSGEGRRNTVIIFVVVLLLIACLGAGGIGAYFLTRGDQAAEEEPAVAYILDTSPRMNLAAEQGTRLSVAQAIMAEVVRPADPELTAGLRVFGSDAVAQACDDTELIVPFSTDNQAAIADSLRRLAVGGSAESALAQSMIAAIRDLNDVAGPQFIVVVTGGEDSCNPQADDLVAAEAKRAGIDLQTYVVGFMVSEQQAIALKTLAEKAGSGSYYNAPDAAALRVALLDIRDRIQRGGGLSAVAEEPVAEADEPASTPAPAEPTAATDEASTIAGGYQSQTACDLPYFPLREGAHWNYSYDGIPATWDVISVTGDLGAATATVVIETEGIGITYTWDCGADGIFYYQTGVFDFSELGGSFEAQLTSQTGSPLPPPEAFVPGASWTSAYTMTMSFEVEGVGFEIINDVEETYTAGELQEMTTAAGSFEVIPVSTSGTTTTSSFGSTFTNSSNGTCLFAVGVGWLGCTTTAAGETSVSELVSYSIP
jgi:von Willebrand factor type A domain